MSENQKRIKVIACATVVEEMLPILPDNIDYEVLEYGLHLVPNNLKKSLQKAIDAASPSYETIILGYGLCSLAVIGLKAEYSQLVVPRVDDCIALYLGSREAYNRLSKKEPGTYYLTKGWIEVGDTIYEDYQRTMEKFGEAKAARIMGIMLKHYTRLVYIDTGQLNQETYRAYAQKTAEHFNLRYEEVEGSTGLIRKMMSGPWDEEFVVTPPGQTIHYTDFSAPSDSAAKPSPNADAGSETKGSA